MDRFSVDGSDKKLIYQEALEFLGEVRAGVSKERFRMGAVRYADAFIDMLNETEEARQFLSLKGVGTEYAHKHIRGILTRLHFNREDDHYLTLCLPRSASEAQINRRWKDLMLIYHPDRNKDADAGVCAKRINEAYNVLKHPDKKREYDMKMTATVTGYSGSRRKSVFRSQELQRYPFISPRMRRLLPRLIIPCCLAISSIILFAIFLDNRPDFSPPAKPSPSLNAKIPEKKVITAQAVEETPLINAHQEPAPSVEYRQFYRESPAGERVRNIAGAVKRMDVVDAEARVIQSSGPSDLPRDSGRTVVLTPPPPLKKDPVQRVEPAAAQTGRNISAAAAPLANPVPEKVPQDRILQNNLPPARTDSTPGRIPGSNEGDTALNVKYSELETEVFLFLVRYIQAYEEGDINKFMSFFSLSAVENNKARYEDIKRSYGKNFESGRYSYTLKNVSIKGKDGNIAATADYAIKKITGGGKGQPLTGKMRWTLGRENGSLKILRMDYDRR